MKKSTKTSRRSFLKQSALGLAAASTAALFAQLPNAYATYQGPPAIDNGYCLGSKYTDFYSSNDGYDTEESALQDAMAAFNDWISNPAGQVWVDDPTLFVGYDCPALETPIGSTSPESPEPEITEDAQGNFSYVFSFRQTIKLCNHDIN